MSIIKLSVLAILLVVAVEHVSAAGDCCSDLPAIIADLHDRLDNQQREIENLKAGGYGPVKKGCRVFLRSWGFEDVAANPPRLCQMAVNGVYSLNMTAADQPKVIYRGINLMSVDPNTCKAGRVLNYDTHAYRDQAVRLDAYLSNLEDGNVVVGVACDSAQWNGNLDPARETFKSLGVNVDGMSLRTKVVFIIKKGDVRASTGIVTAKGGASLELSETVTA